MPPIISFTDSNNTSITSLSFGGIDAGSTSDPIEIHIWNNKGGTPNVPNTTNTRITTKTYNGLDTGDTVPNGQEVVTYKMIQVKNISLSTPETFYTSIGGPDSHAIGASTSEIIEGASPGGLCVLQIRAEIPTNATSGNIQFLIRVLYQYV